MTSFRLTVPSSSTAMILFANDKFYGAAPLDPCALNNRNYTVFAHTPKQVS
jgi:hypothetical protein